MSGIEYFIHSNIALVYIIIFFGVIIEGEGIVLFSSVFAWQGLLNWPLLTLVIITGTISGDLLWYGAGRYLKGTKFGCWLDKRYEKYGGALLGDKVMARYHWYAILNKFMYFTTKPTIFLVGWHDFNFKKFLKITSYSTVIWTLTMLLLGSIFGYTIHLIGFKKIVHRVEIFAVLLFVGIFILEWGIKKLVTKRVLRIGPTSPINQPEK